MAMRQNAIDNELSYPQAAKAVLKSFYVHVDDGLTGADSGVEAIKLREKLQELFPLGGFELQKWKSSKKAVSRSIPFPFLDQ